MKIKNTIIHQIKPFRKLISMLLFITFWYSVSNAQDKVSSKNSIYLELLGNAYYYSINFDRKLANLSEKTTFGARIGIGGTTFLEEIQLVQDDDFYIDVFAIPVETYLLFGKQNKFFELGVGIMPGLFYTQYGDAWKTDYFVNVGYRYQPQDGGFFFKTGLAFQYAHAYGLEDFLPYPKVGFGYTFQN